MSNSQISVPILCANNLLLPVTRFYIYDFDIIFLIHQATSLGLNTTNRLTEVEKYEKEEESIQFYYPEYKLRVIGRGWLSGKPTKYRQKCKITLDICVKFCYIDLAPWKEVFYEFSSKCCTCAICKV